MAKIESLPPWILNENEPSWGEAQATAVVEAARAEPTPDPEPVVDPHRDPVTKRWLPGCPSPNPSGRPAGRWSNRLHSMVPKALAVIEKALDEGDLSAVAHLLSRTIPALKAETPAVEFEFDPSASPADMSSQILLAVSKGQLTPDVAKTMQDMIAAHVGLRDVETFEAELRRVESKQMNRVRGGVLVDANHSSS